MTAESIFGLWRRGCTSTFISPRTLSHRCILQRRTCRTSPPTYRARGVTFDAYMQIRKRRWQLSTTNNICYVLLNIHPLRSIFDVISYHVVLTVILRTRRSMSSLRQLSRCRSAKEGKTKLVWEPNFIYRSTVDWTGRQDNSGGGSDRSSRHYSYGMLKCVIDWNLLYLLVISLGTTF